MNVSSKTYTQEDLRGAVRVAASEIGVRIYNLRETGRRGVAFTLKTGEPAERRPDWRGKLRWAPRFQRTSQHTRRSTAAGYEGREFNPTVPGAVCWHGHREFFKALYELVPDVKVRTALAVYDGREDFERQYPATRYRGGDRMGVSMLPYADACTCQEGGQ